MLHKLLLTLLLKLPTLTLLPLTALLMLHKQLLTLLLKLLTLLTLMTTSSVSLLLLLIWASVPVLLDLRIMYHNTQVTPVRITSVLMTISLRLIWPWTLLKLRMLLLTLHKQLLMLLL
jgi:hypothetical protein